MRSRTYLIELVPFAALVMVECFDVGLTTLSKAAMSKGMSHFVFVVYSNAFATLILIPCSLIANRRSSPPVSFNLLSRFFLLSIAGITVMQNCVFTGISYSSPTLASALSNLIPASTFLLAVIFRMEKLDFRSSRGKIKVVGTLISISGALIVTLYKGTLIGTTPVISFQQLSALFASQASNWVTGGLFIAIACLSVSVWNISQAAMLKDYPSKLTTVTFYTLFGSIQCAIVSLLFVRDTNAWKLKHSIELISIIYSATFGGAITFSVQTWCINKKGPLFVAMFKPIGIAIAAFMSVIFLGDALHVGSIVGAIVIVVGFYAVIWAQRKEGEPQKAESRIISSEESPLLDNQNLHV